MDQQSKQFNFDLIDLIIGWNLAAYAGYSVHSSLKYAVRYLPEPSNSLWKTVLETGEIIKLWEAIPELQNRVQSEGLAILLEHLHLFWNAEFTPFDHAIEPALDKLWTQYDPTTKPDSVNFQQVMQWLSKIDTNKTTQQQFTKMGSHAIPYIAGAINFGADNQPKALINFLVTIDSPLVVKVLTEALNSPEHQPFAQIALAKRNDEV